MSRQMDREHQKRWSKEQIFGKWVVVATTGGHRLHTHAHSPDTHSCSYTLIHCRLCQAALS